MRVLIFLLILLLTSCSSTSYDFGVVKEQKRQSLGSSPKAHIDTAAYQKTYVAYTEDTNKILVYNAKGDLIWEAEYVNVVDIRINFFMMMLLIALAFLFGWYVKE